MGGKTHRLANAAEGAGGGVLPEDTREKELSLAERDMAVRCWIRYYLMFLAERIVREQARSGEVEVAGGVRWVTMSRRAIGRNRANFLKKPIFEGEDGEGDCPGLLQ